MLCLFGAVLLTFQLIRLALGGLLGIWLPKPTWDRSYLFLLWLYAAPTKAHTHMTHDLWTLTTRTAACGCVCASVSGWYRANSFRGRKKNNNSRIFECVDRIRPVTGQHDPESLACQRDEEGGQGGGRLCQFINKHNYIWNGWYISPLCCDIIYYLS